MARRASRCARSANAAANWSARREERRSSARYDGRLSQRDARHPAEGDGRGGPVVRSSGPDPSPAACGRGTATSTIRITGGRHARAVVRHARRAVAADCLPGARAGGDRAVRVSRTCGSWLRNEPDTYVDITETIDIKIKASSSTSPKAAPRPNRGRQFRAQETGEAGRLHVRQGSRRSGSSTIRRRNDGRADVAADQPEERIDLTSDERADIEVHPPRGVHAPVPRHRN